MVETVEENVTAVFTGENADLVRIPKAFRTRRQTLGPTNRARVSLCHLQLLLGVPPQLAGLLRVVLLERHRGVLRRLVDPVGAVLAALALAAARQATLNLAVPALAAATPPLCRTRPTLPPPPRPSFSPASGEHTPLARLRAVGCRAPEEPTAAAKAVTVEAAPAPTVSAPWKRVRFERGSGSQPVCTTQAIGRRWRSVPRLTAEEQEKAERRRLVPYHMWINLDLVEAVHLVTAMLLELPNLAHNAYDPKRRSAPVSRTFRRYLDQHERQVFTGPPEGTRDYVMRTSKLLLDGDITIHQLDLDGGLVVRAARGAREAKASVPSFIARQHTRRGPILPRRSRRPRASVLHRRVSTR